MAGLEIRRASVNLNNAPGAIAAGNAQAISRFTPYQYRDQAGDMIKGIGRALDTAVKFGSDFIDERIEQKDKSDYAAMRADYDKAMGLKMNEILARNDNDLSQVKPEEYQKASKEVTDAIVKQYKPMARTMHQFNEHRGQAEASGAIRIDGAVKKASDNIYQARLVGAEQSALERHTAEQSTTSLENYWQAVYTRNEGKYGAEVANQMANSAVRKAVVQDKINRINAADDEKQLDEYAKAMDSGKLADAMDRMVKEAKEQGKEPDFSKVNEMGQILYKHNALRPDKEETRILDEAIDRRRKIIRAEKEEQQRQTRRVQTQTHNDAVLRINTPGVEFTEAQLLTELDAIVKDQTTYAGASDIKQRLIEAYEIRINRIRNAANAQHKAQDKAAEDFRKADADDILNRAACLQYHNGEKTEAVMAEQFALIERIHAGLKEKWLDRATADEAYSRITKILTEDEKTALRYLDEKFNINWTSEDKTGRFTGTKNAPDANFKYKDLFGNTQEWEISADEYSSIRAETLKQLRQLPKSADRITAVKEIVNTIRTGFVQNKLEQDTEKVTEEVRSSMYNRMALDISISGMQQKDDREATKVKKNYYNATKLGIKPSETTKPELDKNGASNSKPDGGNN